MLSANPAHAKGSHPHSPIVCPHLDQYPHRKQGSVPLLLKTQRTSGERQIVVFEVPLLLKTQRTSGERQIVVSEVPLLLKTQRTSGERQIVVFDVCVDCQPRLEWVLE